MASEIKQPRLYAARMKNAVLMGKKIEDLLKRGFMVRDGEDHQVSAIVFDEDANGYMQMSYQVKGYPNCMTVLYNSNPDNDEGAHTPVADFNKYFEAWKAVHPANVVKITEA